ncbi:hypothetical protein J2T12_003401 [Paenibacillus anaericanus]|uniref:Uncharacterized protein n=1 Tax=Paenibacillus anaericanus TaxID=170367 RepID=A0A433XVB3_9BACL|nr:hypothetical protein [Paenibacillus anaericanus]MDQ0089988.1 hypothetical protein [Paenibacillus anaericanus]RUT38540.1 hypothetical protein EJP82_27065 [Paenibacillus anaericanus]
MKKIFTMLFSSVLLLTVMVTGVSASESKSNISTNVTTRDAQRIPMSVNRTWEGQLPAGTGFYYYVGLGGSVTVTSSGYAKAVGFGITTVIVEYAGTVVLIYDINVNSI